MICMKVNHLFTMTNDYCLSRLLTDLSFLLKDGYNLLEFIIKFEFIMTLDYGVNNTTTHETIIFPNKQERNGNWKCRKSEKGDMKTKNEKWKSNIKYTYTVAHTQGKYLLVLVLVLCEQVLYTCTFDLIQL